MDTPERARAYTDMFDKFIHDRGLDIDDDYWSAEDVIAWEKLVAAFDEK